MNDLTIRIEYRKIKNINFYVRDGQEILVTAPKGIKRKELEQIISEKEEWIRRALSKSGKKEMPKDIGEEQVRVLKENTMHFVKYWEPIMGVHATGWSFRNMKTRWGSCTVSSGKIRINTRLSLYPLECLELIVVHELCHLIEPSHNERFKAYMTKFLPDWKKRNQLLKTYG
ncbi:M48 family metallopeptidase [Aequitasia blattaphilus]|uniref:M48 family metallopeptidase n=1 Tax=Aequitasia blattaphilus TaxID=2949332 RepID=A0ABT1ECG7_9FIRM|nr:M48 family metallopeptidase [Aequitasia blattaphilus]MCP1103529.1 M48 family metallopeptidase [Aequitasia blattaphilus]MCR8616169.1 M48 family metallopeptidase [Aequitasia blattaphilus]